MSWVQVQLDRSRQRIREALVYQRRWVCAEKPAIRYQVELWVYPRKPPQLKVQNWTTGMAIHPTQWPLSLLSSILVFLSEVAPEMVKGPATAYWSVFDDESIQEFDSAFDIVRGEVEWQENVEYPRDARGREYQELEGLVQAMGANDAGFFHAWIRVEDRGVFRVFVLTRQGPFVQLGDQARFRVYREDEGLLMSHGRGQ